MEFFQINFHDKSSCYQVLEQQEHVSPIDSKWYLAIHKKALINLLKTTGDAETLSFYFRSINIRSVCLQLTKHSYVHCLICSPQLSGEVRRENIILILRMDNLKLVVIVFSRYLTLNK